MELRPQASAQKREQIYQAAVVEFQEKGFSDASMDRISARAGVSKRTVYKYYESKEKLFQELLCRHWGRFAASLDVVYDKDRDIRDQLTALGRAEGALLTNPDVMAMTRLVMSEVLRSPELVGENEEKTDFQAAFETMLREADADGVLEIEDPKVAAEEFIALIKGKAFWPVVFGAAIVTAAEMEKIVESSVEMIICRYGV
ncbi:TetR/AcrR family transcriptional regulator [Yoonia sediminilitoris]|uniref:TetR family transcriptional regulator n=1 Tax=Yoonia sediminilitoris TaxID=1286148 RepID=A0A2T6KMN7_9RHOB|nr:TetR/AcrR family transcriptional regulator [Yoonia sediminilitoris]PUB17466.1 TetR family transcriptional regulator [Yoonia sediminilitoris]RCW97761.1 TetR family transcriptional regulator [Yoonia sediminilitoris]